MKWYAPPPDVDEDDEDDEERAQERRERRAESEDGPDVDQVDQERPTDVLEPPAESEDGPDVDLVDQDGQSSPQDALEPPAAPTDGPDVVDVDQERPADVLEPPHVDGGDVLEPVHEQDAAEMARDLADDVRRGGEFELEEIALRAEYDASRAKRPVDSIAVFEKAVTQLADDPGEARVAGLPRVRAALSHLQAIEPPRAPTIEAMQLPEAPRAIAAPRVRTR